MRKILTLFLLLLTSTIYACQGEKIMENPIVTIIVAGYDEPMILELYYDKAPNTVRNFVYLASSGFYTGSTFHRVIEDFMIQGGIGSSSACVIKGEFTSNGFSENDISHIRGVISMARTTVKNSATSQFFIVHKDSTFLDGNYAAFGMLISGFSTLDGIARVNTSSDKPIVDVVITSITVDTHGDTFEDPTCY